MSDIEARRAANRAAFPAVSQIVDQFRAVFGEGVTAAGGSENGKSFGVCTDPVWQADESACEQCSGDSCGRTDKATTFCGYRTSNEAGFLLGKMIETGKSRFGK